MQKPYRLLDSCWHGLRIEKRNRELDPWVEPNATNWLRRIQYTGEQQLYLGIDLGTSAVKAVLLDEDDRITGQSTASLDVSTPHRQWSEQDPEDWWIATCCAVDELKALHAPALAAVRAMGLSGQMHGATLLDSRGKVLRPAILWNDGRSGAECIALEAAVPNSRSITGNLAMPGFTAPKLIWIATHEPEVFSRVAKVLLPKDYLRYRLSGDHAADMSDASGTLWLDVENRRWSEEMLAATDLDLSHMPRLVEGSSPSASLSPSLARQWGLSREVVIAGGAGDNAAGAAGIGAVAPGSAFLSLGTSGVLFAANRAYAPNPERAVHAFCHCFPDTWHQMSVILSAGGALAWAAAATGARNESSLAAEAEPAEAGLERIPLFLPYLAGERTPHNDPHAKGVFFGLDLATARGDLGWTVLEGVAFALADGHDALVEAGTALDHISVIGGGAQSTLWGRILAAALRCPLSYHAGSNIGPALGAARLARLAATGERPEEVCTPPDVDRVIEPDDELVERLAPRLERWRTLYGVLRQEMREFDSA